MRENFIKKLNGIYSKVYSMGENVFKQLELSLDTLIAMNDKNIEEILSYEDKNNTDQIDIENDIVLLLATESPVVAQDLREMIASLKIISSLERIADYSVHLARSVNKMPFLIEEYKTDIIQIRDIILSMFMSILNSYKNNDKSLAKDTARRDKEVDQLHDLYIQKLYHHDKKSIELKIFARLLIIIKNLERTGDQLKNICEFIVYGITNDRLDL
ncbi:MAG: phosphate signaling complex protein PhoU [Spirochaetes bacterium]|nr:phosphate signaling complex protein PhoU [Spirochaetota bacterium]